MNHENASAPPEALQAPTHSDTREFGMKVGVSDRAKRFTELMRPLGCVTDPAGLNITNKGQRVLRLLLGPQPTQKNRESQTILALMK